MNKKSRKTLAIIFGSGLLVILGLIFLLNRSGGGEEYMTPSGIIAETVPTVFPDYSVPRVGLREAKRVFDEDGAIFVDVRSASSFEQTHIPGAVSAPLNLNNYFIDAPQDAIIFTYCT